VKITCSQKEQVSAYDFALLWASDSLLASEYRFERHATIGMFIFFTTVVKNMKGEKNTITWKQRKKHSDGVYYLTIFGCVHVHRKTETLRRSNQNITNSSIIVLRCLSFEICGVEFLIKNISFTFSLVEPIKIFGVKELKLGNVVFKKYIILIKNSFFLLKNENVSF